MASYRFIVAKDFENKTPVWLIYKVYGRNSKDEFVARIYDESTVELLLEAPALKFMRQREKNFKLHNLDKPRSTKSGFCDAFMRIIRKIK